MRCDARQLAQAAREARLRIVGDRGAQRRRQLGVARIRAARGQDAGAAQKAQHDRTRPLIVVAGEIVVDVVLVELVGDTEVLVVAGIVVVVAPVVVVVRSVVVVVVVEGEQVDTNVTEADAAAWKPSGHVACSDNMTSPVNPPGTMVVAEVWPLLATSE